MGVNAGCKADFLGRVLKSTNPCRFRPTGAAFGLPFPARPPQANRTVIHPHSHVARREESPDTIGQDSRRKSGHGSNRDGQCHRKQTAVPARETVRVKRWGKSPPLQGRPRRHGKPNPVQDKQGPPEAAHQGSGLSHRRKAGPQGQRNECARAGESHPGQNPAYSG